MARTVSSKQEKIDQKFRLLCRDLNQYIIHTVEYNYGGFRFRVYKGEKGNYTILLADTDWHKEFGDKFKKAAKRHGYDLEYDSRVGMYYIRPLNNKKKNNDTKRVTIYELED